VKVNDLEVAIINLQGRTFMSPIDCPFKKADELIEQARSRTPFIFVDFHAEVTSEKQAMGWYLDGRVSAVVGTHTHVQTADNRILPGGTGYLSDVGMTGPYDGILGVEKETVIKRFLTSLPVRFEVPKTGRAQLSAVSIELDRKTGFTKKMERILISEDHPFYS
jgi:2',3'-cyclic-nucleotide 2'-phosphodiesterase